MPEMLRMAVVVEETRGDREGAFIVFQIDKIADGSSTIAGHPLLDAVGCWIDCTD
jgi:hypothetical protein